MPLEWSDSNRSGRPVALSWAVTADSRGQPPRILGPGGHAFQPLACGGGNLHVRGLVCMLCTVTTFKQGQEE